MVNPSGMMNLPNSMFPAYGAWPHNPATGYFPTQANLQGTPNAVPYGAGMSPMGGVPMMMPNSPYQGMPMNPYPTETTKHSIKINQPSSATIQGQMGGATYPGTAYPQKTPAYGLPNVTAQTQTTHPYMNPSYGMPNEYMGQQMSSGMMMPGEGYSLGNAQTKPYGYGSSTGMPTPYAPVLPENSMYPGLNESTNPAFPPTENYPMGGLGHAGHIWSQYPHS